MRLFRRVEDAVKYSAIWFADTWGFGRYPYLCSVMPMEDVFLSARIDEKRLLCISPISARTYKEAGGKGLGGEYGYFIYEVDDTYPNAGIEVIGKAASVDAALRLFDLICGNVRAVAA